MRTAYTRGGVVSLSIATMEEVYRASAKRKAEAKKPWRWSHVQVRKKWWLGLPCPSSGLNGAAPMEGAGRGQGATGGHGA